MLPMGYTSIARPSLNMVDVLRILQARGKAENLVGQLMDSYVLLVWYFDDMLEWNSGPEDPKVIEVEKDGVTTRYHVIPKPKAHVQDARDNFKKMQKALLKVINSTGEVIKRLKVEKLDDEIGALKPFAINYKRVIINMWRALGDEDLEAGKRVAEIEAQRIVVALLQMGEQASKFETLKLIQLKKEEEVKPEPVKPEPEEMETEPAETEPMDTD